MITIDFETAAITKDPLDYPPIPVGVSIKVDDGPSTYHRGTPLGLQRLLMPLWNQPLLMHNASFDLMVAMGHCDMPYPREAHDTLPLLFLRDPYAKTLSLKPSAEALLDWPPEEQADLRDWILANVRGATRRNFGAHIAQAPFELVKPYAEGDTDRTKALWDVLQDYRGEAYDREMAVLPILLGNEQTGIRVDAKRLAHDVDYFRTRLERVDQHLHRALGGSFDVDSNEELADQLERALRLKLPLTEKGSRRTDKDTLRGLLMPDSLKVLLLYRSALAQDLRTFLTPWEAMAGHNGCVYTHWNSIRGAGNRKGGGGARTGRLSSEPNFQNIPSVDKRTSLYERLAALLGCSLADARRRLPLPTMRSYIVPWEDDWVVFGRDFSQQELRLLAFFEDGPLLELYQQFPEMDIHQAVGELIATVTGNAFPRKLVKILNFLTIYGGGAGRLAEQAGITVEEAQAVREAYFNALPSVRKLMRQVSQQSEVKTLGGRAYFAERGFEYKLLNYLIQGSAADQTKEALRLWSRSGARAKFYLTVHDELVFTCPRANADEEMRLLQGAMDGAFADRLDVPFRSDGYVGTTWALDDK